MENDDILAKANEALDKRLTAKEVKLSELESRAAQLRELVAEEDAFVQRLRSFVGEAEIERTRLQREFHRLVSTGQCAMPIAKPPAGARTSAVATAGYAKRTSAHG